MKKAYMNNRYSGILTVIVTLFVSAFSFVSCVDEYLYDDSDLGVIDGSMRDLHVEIAFEPQAERALDTRAADTPQLGNSIQNISDLRILIYKVDADGSAPLLHNLHIVKGGNGTADGIITNVTYKKDNDNRLSGEKNLQDSVSGKVTFDISLPSAEYYIYAVANAEDIPAERLADRNLMKNTPRRWVAGDLSANSEMFGIFSNAPDRSATDEKPLAVTNRMVNLHCWLRRLASKVTVAFDGTELYDNVQVFIQSVSLHDIPQQCLLGNPNTAGRDYSKDDPGAMLPCSAGDDSRYIPETNGVIKDGAKDFIQDLDNTDGKMMLPATFKHVCRRSHAYLGVGDEGNDPTIITNTHAHSAKSLFFYENMQGTGKSKKQDHDDNKVIDFPKPEEYDMTSGWKDNKPFGTYVEVYGYYRCTNNDRSVNTGPIRYRFMLGKDTDKDYDAERNTHYQLTLKLRGYANDYDWHIDYKHEREFVVNSPQFISYLFNKKMMMTVKVAGEIPDNYKLKAEIMNDRETWRAWGDGSDILPTPGGGFMTGEDTSDDGPWNSFLSLKKTKVIKIESPDMPNAPSNKYNYSISRTVSKNYYESNEIGFRTYNVVPSEWGYDSNSKDGKGSYFVSASRIDEDGTVNERIFSIPLYTRAKELVTWSGFTGNNPYAEYSRKQRVRIFLVDENGHEVTKENKYYVEPKTVDVIQVPRVVNPKGVWRKAGSTEEFHVTLTHPDHGDNEQSFYAFKSVGKWSAEVISASAPIISLTNTKEGSGAHSQSQDKVSRIEGESEHPIDFKINFNGQTGFAIVKIRYNNYTCEHDIFCRNGYGPVDIAGDGQLEWRSLNVDHFNSDGTVELTKSPLQEGSLFKYKSLTAILPTKYGNPSFGVRPSSSYQFAVKTAGGTEGKSKWSDIKVSISKDNAVSGKITDEWIIKSTVGERIPTGPDYYTLIAKNASDVDFPISKAYGVLYGDGATKTQMTSDMAYGYDLTNEDGDNPTSPKGMRGCFVYNNDNYKQIFFPLGKEGHGHRKTSGGWRNNDTNGTLRYAGRSERVGYYAGDNSMNRERPLFYDLYERPGAIYWIKDFYESRKILHTKEGQPGDVEYEDATQSSSFDINYFTMGFEGYGNDAIPSRSDTHACFIRTVIPKTQAAKSASCKRTAKRKPASANKRRR